MDGTRGSSGGAHVTGENQLRLAAAVVAVGLGVMSADLRWAWQHSPYDQGAGWMAAIWLMGVIFVALKKQSVPIARLVLAAVVAGLVSFIGELNVARHSALVLVLVAWLPAGWTRWVVALSGVSWWPALGWATAQFTGPGGTVMLRFGLLMVGVLALLRLARAPREEGQL
jgi:hypothetical protein